MINKALIAVVLLTIALATYFFVVGDGEPAPSLTKLSDVLPGNVKTAVFAGGCFWCMEAPFEKINGVVSVESGYTGGKVENPTYEQVCRGETGHVEAIRVTYDDAQLTYEDLLEVFWRNIDPTDAEGQFADRGATYGTAIFVENVEQRDAATESKSKLEMSKRFDAPIVTPIRDLDIFYLAEEYHQDYYITHALNYRLYRRGSGRDAFLKSAWGDELEFKPKNRNIATPFTIATGENGYSRPSEQKIREMLTPLQFEVTQHEGTEPPFQNAFWDNKRKGIYVDIVSGEPLFSSKDKYKSGTGWPSFTRPLVPNNIVEKKDTQLFYSRTEIRSRHADSHLGHVFDDGPAPTGMRFCMNSSALRFVPAEDLESAGYGEFASLFMSVDEK